MLSITLSKRNDFVNKPNLFQYFHVIEEINAAVGNVDANGNALTTLTNQPLLELVYAILLFGIGGALVFNSGASSCRRG